MEKTKLARASSALDSAKTALYAAEYDLRIAENNLRVAIVEETQQAERENYCAFRRLWPEDMVIMTPLRVEVAAAYSDGRRESPLLHVVQDWSSNYFHLLRNYQEKERESCWQGTPPG